MTRSDGRRIRVLIVDDSALVRQTLASVLESEPDIEVIGTASDPYVAARHIREQVPDVITLDLEMPRMDGLTFLGHIMDKNPIPTLVCSTLTEQGSASAFAALERGAVDVIAKPKVGTKEFFAESRAVISDAIRAAARVDPRKLAAKRRSASGVRANVVCAPTARSGPRPAAMLETTAKVIAIGASTGGTQALETILTALPVDACGVVVVQHMPEQFTKRFAERLDASCKIRVKEAQSGDTVLRGQALIAPGGRHMLLQRSGARYYVDVREGPLVSRHRPSVDVLFRSTARYAGANAVGVILTGMGDDGARGLAEMKAAGAFTIAQDEASSIVFGMPGSAIRAGGVQKVVGLDRIATEMQAYAA